jgi:predicted O-methyltransferase YrrM
MNLQQVIMRDQHSTEGLLQMISELPNKGTMIEIGTFTGESTVIFGDHFEKVIGVDPMLSGYDKNDMASQFDFNEVLDMFVDRTKDYKNIQLITKTSDDAVSDFQDESLDFVYIDGIHTYDQVKKDIQNYLSKVKKGGVIGGHDYVQGWSGVMKAVNEVLGKPDKTFKEGSWIKFL